MNRHLKRIENLTVEEKLRYFDFLYYNHQQHDNKIVLDTLNHAYNVDVHNYRSVFKWLCTLYDKDSKTLAIMSRATAEYMEIICLAFIIVYSQNTDVGAIAKIRKSMTSATGKKLSTCTSHSLKARDLYDVDKKFRQLANYYISILP